MNRILFEENEIVDGRAVFSDERAEHVLNVLHGSVGQVLKTGEIDGLVGTSTIVEIRNLHERAPGSAQRGNGLWAGEIVVECSHSEKSAEPWIDLILAPPRPRVLKRLLPQLAAMGVGKIVLVGAEKVEKAFWGAQLVKEDVYRPLLVDGLMQCGTTILPTIRIEKNFRRYVDERMEEEFADHLKIVAHPPKDGELSAACSRLPERPVVAIGSEGGWTDDEVALLESKGFSRYSLGSRILRTDTATIAVIAQLMGKNKSILLN
ncbi:MAG: 16S rRNA (uracil(1498)-N(3))-methyltransferase [Kiritimatiellae bacterium]|nr:16S rRNA (uracil(1498)-N(3))-methyltransferase [Kiritimatiellia bacterium]